MGNVKVLYMSLHDFNLSESKLPGREHIDWVTIDESIAEAISMLNKKGYFTSMCCQGHIPKMEGKKLLGRMHQCYICFNDDIIINSFPRGFVPRIMKIGLYPNTIISNISFQYKCADDSTQCKTEEMIAQEIKERNMNLLAWARSLPEYQMMDDEEKQVSM